MQGRGKERLCFRSLNRMPKCHTLGCLFLNLQNLPSLNFTKDEEILDAPSEVKEQMLPWPVDPGLYNAFSNFQI